MKSKIQSLRLFVLSAIITLTAALPAGATAAPGLSKRFAVRSPQSKAQEFDSYLSNANLISWVEYLQGKKFEQASAQSLIDEALMLAVSDPLASYQKFDSALKEIYSQLLTPESRDLAAGVLNRMAKLAVPLRLQKQALERAHNLAAGDESEVAVESTAARKGKSPLNSGTLQLALKEWTLHLEALKKNPNLSEALILQDGHIVDAQHPPGGEGQHQWALLSNVYEPVLFNGEREDFWRKLEESSSLVPLTTGGCHDAQITSNNFELQSQALIFVSTACTAQGDGAAESRFSNQNHLAKIPEIKQEKRGFIYAAFVALGVGLALKDKSVSIRAPSFK